MIDLNLLLFGGNGSGSGGHAGGGKGGTGSTNASSSSAPSHHGSSGGRQIDGGKENRTIRLGSYVDSVNDIKANKDYFMYRAKDNKGSDVTGERLLKMIDEKRIWYDKKKKLWVSNTGKNYDIRVRR